MCEGVGGTLGSMAVGGTLGSMGGEGTFGSVAGRICGSVGGSVAVEVFVVELKRVARWSKCFLFRFLRVGGASSGIWREGQR